MLSGTITALVTPMSDDGHVDYDSLNKLIEFQVTNGVSGLVILGSTGESATLSSEEKFKIIHYVLEKKINNVKIIVGVNFANTIEAVEFTKKLNVINGIDYVMALTPYYVKPTQDGLYNHFAAIAVSSEKPIILYNVPSRTSCDLQDKTTLELANNFSNIVGIKDATGNIARASYLVKNRPAGFMLFSGDDSTALAFMLCGGDGVISVVSNLVPKEMSEMSNLAIAGNKYAAIEANNKIMDLYDAMGLETNPIPIKWLLARKGVIDAPYLRLPLTVLGESYQNKIKLLVENIVIAN